MRKAVALSVVLLLASACGDDVAPAGGQGAGGNGGAGGAGGAPEACFVPPTDPEAPSPDDVSFERGAGLLDGEQILFNDWNSSPNELLTMRADGSAEQLVLRAYRVWSFGVSPSLAKIAFAAGDPNQEANFGITLGDAIQPTFIYDLGCDSVGALTWGNLNDECHAFGPDGTFLYLCRRYDFDDDGMSKGYRVARVAMSDGALEWLTPEEQGVFRFSAQPLPGETEIVFYRVPVPGTASVMRAAIPNGEEQTIREGVGYPRLSPDGTRLLVADFDQGGDLTSIDLMGGSSVLVAEGEGLTTSVWSPDGSRVAFLRWDDAGACSHVEVVAADGSEAASSTRIHDCMTSGRFITDLAWVGQ